MAPAVAAGRRKIIEYSARLCTFDYELLTVEARVRKLTLAIILLVVSTSGCYRATVDTGLTPSGETVRVDWAHSFVGGLVPPATVQTAQQCPAGVARVETQHSFLNMLAAGLTFGLYTPMTITVQCARAAEENDATTLLVPASASLATAISVFNEAVARAAGEDRAVLVQFQ
jgi:hypothetical protein